jgi:hypothetical protein
VVAMEKAFPSSRTFHGCKAWNIVICIGRTGTAVRRAATPPLCVHNQPGLVALLKENQT